MAPIPADSNGHPFCRKPQKGGSFLPFPTNKGVCIVPLPFPCDSETGPWVSWVDPSETPVAYGMTGLGHCWGRGISLTPVRESEWEAPEMGQDSLPTSPELLRLDL